MAGKKACVVGGSGFVASALLNLLLDKGYSVNTTVRDPDNKKKVSHLKELQKLGDLKIFQADLTEELSFDAPVEGCEFVFLVATPVNFASEDPENDMIKPACQGVINVLRACARAGSIKRVVLTSSVAAVANNALDGSGLVMSEENWTEVEFLYAAKPLTWGYAVSKTLAEKAAWKFAEENKIDLVSVIPSVIAGRSLTSDVPGSISAAAGLLTGDESSINILKSLEMVSSSIWVVHIEDVCRAHLFLAEKESAAGRYICSAANTNVTQLAKFLSKRYPQFMVPTDFDDLPPVAKVILSSEKLINEGFEFKYGIEEIYDETVDYLKDVGVLKN